MLDIYALFHKEGNNVEFAKWGLIFFLIILMAYEVLQMIVEGNPYRYLIQVENFFDVLGFLIILFYCIIYLFDKEIATKTNYHANFLCFGMLIANLRLMIHLSIFNESLRQMIMSIEQSIIKILPFVVVLYCLIYTMAMCTYIVQNDNDRDTAKK